MKTLYLSDLDGSLLRSDERVSEYTANIINRFVQMSNAVPELKEIATAVIDSNDNDGVAKWFKGNIL